MWSIVTVSGSPTLAEVSRIDSVADGVARARSESPEPVASAARCEDRVGDGSSPCVAREESVGSWGHMQRASPSSAAT
jgi:hypothetical protein